jgi:hypothetical protein
MIGAYHYSRPPDFDTRRRFILGVIDALASLREGGAVGHGIRAAAKRRNSSTYLFRPVLDGQPFEPREIFVVRSREHKAIHMGNRGNLTVDERRRPAQRFKSRPFLAVPGRRSLVIRQDRKRTVHDVAEISLQRRAAFPLRKSPRPVGQFVPYESRDRALWTVHVQTLENGWIGCLRDGRGDDARVEKICDLQSVTLRPVVLSRAAAAKSLSRPISSSEWVLRNFLYASRKWRRFPRSRSNSRHETRTATGCPRRVNSTSIPASA